MTREWAGEAVRGVQTLLQGVGAGLSDAELLHRFVARDEAAAAAFEVLVARHGPAVWGVCRRTLVDPADALDAFQATFLILVRKASSVRVGDSLGPWLHGVSLRVARRARADVARRRGRERTNAEPIDRVAIEAEPFDDLRAVLDHELARLPARYRSPLMLCYLEGLTHEEAAARLACPVGTVRSRLARGRGLLQSRLVRKGFAPSAVATALAFEARPAVAACSGAIVASTVKLALGRATVGVAPAALVADFGRSILLAKLGRVALVVGFLALATGIAVALIRQPRPEPNDALLPIVTVEQLVTKIEQTEQAYAKGLIETEYEEEAINDRHSMRMLPLRIPAPPGFADEPEERKEVDPVDPKYEKVPGRSSYASDGLRWKASLDSFMVGRPISPDGTRSKYQWNSGGDGTIDYRGDVNFMSVVIGVSERQAGENAAPFLFWGREANKSPLLKDVLVPGAEITQKTVSGYRCYVVRTSRDSLGQVREVVISARQSYLPLTLTKTQNGEVELSKKLLDLRKLPDGRWYPGRLIVEKRFETGTGKFLLESRRETRIVKFEPDHVFQPGEFALKIPWNAKVTDCRIAAIYRNDPWWPEIRDDLVQQFGWPWSDLTPLDELTSPDPALEGRDAPPLSASSWIKGQPLDWEKLRGKVVLLVFPAPGDGAIVPSLRRLQAAYGASGFEVIEAFPSPYDPGWVAQVYASWDVNHAVFQDAPRAGEYGVTCSAYRVNQFPAAYVIDHESKVHVITSGSWSKLLVEQLHRAGAKSAKPLSTSEELGPGSRFRRLCSDWEGWTKRAPSTARFVGKVVDASGKPIAGAKIQCQLFANVQGPGLWLMKMPSARIDSVTSGLDGLFVIEGLCKGNYAFEFGAPGLATRVRNVLIGPELGDIDPQLVLDQADNVSGTILDEAGRPLFGARAELFGRTVEGEFDTTIQTIELAKSAFTDASGRFRFDGLREGRYSLRISAEGRLSQTRENVPAGAADLEFVLKRSAD